MENYKRTPPIADDVIADLGSIAQLYTSKTRSRSSEATFLEIGFGARPHRAFAAQYHFKNVFGVDLDFPLMSPRDFLSVYRTNGALRAIKALTRHLLFDRSEWHIFHKRMNMLLPSYSPEKTKLVIDNVGNKNFWNKYSGPYDIIFSTDVFEHIPISDLKVTLKYMRKCLSPNGICVILPLVYTGIQGGHDPKWYGVHTMPIKDNPGNAWGHLTDSNFMVDTYLNKLSRRDYVNLFKDAGFEIITDESTQDRVGEAFMNSKLRTTLSEWDDYELYSNRVKFVLSLST